MPIIKKPFSLAPLNDNPAVLTATTPPQVSISGGFSHKGGFPTIKFSIPPQPAMLEMSSLKLVGQILVKRANNELLAAVNESTDYANGDGEAGNGAGGNIENLAANMIEATALNLPNWGGVKNVIDKVVLQSKKSLIELSSVNNYGQYVGLTEAYNNNEDDYLYTPLIKSLSAGPNADLVNRRMLTAGLAANNEVAEYRGDVNNRMIGQFFSIPIQLDLMNQQDLFLDDDYLGGLLITLHLASDSAVFNNRFNRAGANRTGVNDMSALSYVLKNIKLEGRYIIPDANDMASIPATMNLDGRLNLINDIHSSNNANAYTPQLQSVKSVVNVFLDTDQTNTFSKNQNNFRMPPGLEAYQQARNGLRFPYNYETIVKPNVDSAVANGTDGGNFEKDLVFPALAYGTAEVRKQFEAALLNGGKPYHSSASLRNTNKSLAEDVDDGAVGANDLKNDNTKADCVGVGADYTLGVGLTQNFVNQDYNLTLKSRVNTGDVKVSAERNGGTLANPLLEQTFIRYNAMFDTQNLVKMI